MRSNMFKQIDRDLGDGTEMGFLIACLLDELYVVECMNNYYRALLCHSEDRVEMLNRVAPVLTAFSQDALLDEITLRLARLVDKERICGKDTFTLNRFDAFANEVESPETYREKLNSAKGCIDDAFKETRNQYLAHLQLDTLRDDAECSYSASCKVQEAVDKCMEFADEAEKTFGIARKHWPNHDESKEVDQLIDVLERGYEQILPRKWWKRNGSGSQPGSAHQSDALDRVASEGTLATRAISSEPSPSIPISPE